MPKATPPGLLLIVVVGFLAPGPARAQYPRPRPGQFEIPGKDFRPDGAWRVRTDRVRATRRQMLLNRAFSALNAPLPGPGVVVRVAGTFHVPVIPIAFSNVSPPSFAGQAQLQDALFSPAPTGRPYSVKTFYQQLSNGYVTMDGVVRDWVTADSTDLYYEDGCNGIIDPCAHPALYGGSIRFGQLLLEALQKNDDGTFDWGQFDNDGPDGIPNSGDDDGVVDFVTFLQPEVDGACGTPHIWAHRFVVSAFNGGSPYVTKSPRRDRNGNPIPGQFIQVDDYTMQSAVGGSNACSGSGIMPIGTVSHETGHAFGLPDLYDVTNVTQGIGEWGLMGSGNYARPYSPSRYEAWSLAEMGWVTVDTLTVSGTLVINPVTSSDTVYYIPAANSSHEYFLLENRQALESDSAQMNPAFGARQKSPGLLVWHVDQDIVDAHGFRNGDNKVNVGPIQGVALLQADGLNQLRTPNLNNRGDVGDSYPGSTGNRKLSGTTNPAAVDNAGRLAGFLVDSISQLSPNGSMRFRFFRRGPSVVAGSTALATVRVNGVSFNRFEDIVAPGYQLAVDTDSLQTANGGRSALQFLSWSNGGPRVQTVTEGPGPDTLIARFAVEHRLDVRAVGGGAYTASPAGDYGNGVLLPQGTTVTLIAAPPPKNLVFSGWSGDTVTNRDTLTVTLTRPIAVTAYYATVVPVSLVNAMNEILGSSPGLDSTQKAFLDQIGNRNGSFDLGDFLAYLDLTGVSPTPKAMARIMTAGKGR